MSIIGVDSLFPTVVGTCERNDLIKPIKNIIKNMKDDEWVEKGSVSVTILDKDKKIKKAITEEVQHFLKEVLSIETKIRMTTSWITKVVKGQLLDVHDHNNSWISGCFYIQDNCEIQFSSQTPQILVEPKVNTVLNSYWIDYEPAAGTMLIFPSKTKHTALTYKFDDVRYSLAFNFMPMGMQGSNDSSYRFSYEE